MGSLRTVVVIFVLCVVLAVNLSLANQQGFHQKQLRIRRQAAEDAASEEVAQGSPKDAAQGNPEPEHDDQANEEQGSTPENQRKEDATEDITQVDPGYPFWTTCNYGVDPIKSCYDCNMLIICKRIGGLVKRCGNPFRPHCNNGTCSPVPSAECA